MRGFYLVEVIITLLIIGIVCAIVIPIQKNFTQRSAAQVAGSALFHAIELARSDALLHGRAVKISYNFRSEGVIFWRAFPNTHQSLEFLPTGFLKAENGTFWYCLKQEKNPRWAIVLNQSGRARMVYPDAEGRVSVDNFFINC